MSERISRREALKRAGLTAGAVAVGPALAHLTRPDRVLAQTAERGRQSGGHLGDES